MPKPHFAVSSLPALLLLALTTGVHTFVGQASGEAEVSDSVTGQVLLAAVDRRVGGKSWTGVTEDQSDIMAALEHWTARTKLRLTRTRL